MTRRHPDEALVSNPNDTAPPRPRPAHQSYTQTTPWSAIRKTRRHPHDALLTNPNDTAPPRPRPGQQSPKHGATERTRCPAIPMAQRHPRDTRTSNPHGTAPHTPHARHARAHPHSLPLRSAARATRRTQPAAAFQETSAPSSHPQIHGFPAPATISQRLTRERAHAHAICRTGPRNPAILATAHDSLRLPRKTMPSEATGRTIPQACHAKRTLRARFPTLATRIRLRDTSGGHLAPHLPRETHAQQRPNARFPTPAMRIHRPVPSRARQCIQSPTPATRNAGHSA